MNYKLTLTAQSPVFIGSGEQLHKNEYVLDGHKAFVLDIRKLYDFMKDRGREKALDDFMIKNYEPDLGKFLRDNKLTKEPFLQYILDAGNSFRERKDKFGKKTSFKNIEKFIRDPYGNPYIPGSSLKGALRTAVSAMGSNNLSNINDVMRGLSISDSNSVSNDDLCLCQKIDIRADGKESPLPLLRECIKPGVSFCFDLSIDEKMFTQWQVYKNWKAKQKSNDGGLCKFILESVAYFSNIQNDFLYKFKDINLKSHDADSIMLGGGAGYVSKTLTYALYDEETALRKTAELMKNNFRKHKHELDVHEFKVSPHTVKCTQYNNKRYEFGIAKIKISES